MKFVTEKTNGKLVISHTPTYYVLHTKNNFLVTCLQAIFMRIQIL